MIISVSDHFGELAMMAGKRLLRHTVQLYPTANINKPRPICTALLVAYKEKRFLVSAAHLMMDLPPDSVAVYVKNELCIPIGNAVYADPRDSRVNNETDLIIWRLADEVADELEEQYEFYRPAELSFNHPFSDKSRYLVVGFPNSKTRLKVGVRKISLNPFIYLTEHADHKYFQQLELQASRNMLFDYKRKRTKGYKTGLVHKGPWTRGLSGCGIWFLPNLLAVKEEDIYPILISVFIEYRKELNVIVSTKLSMARILFEKALV